MFARALHGGNVTAVPHARSTQSAQVVEAARDSGKEAEPVEEAARLEEQGGKDRLMKERNQAPEISSNKTTSS